MSRTHRARALAVLAAVVSAFAATIAPAAQSLKPVPIAVALEQYAARPDDAWPRQVGKQKDFYAVLRKYRDDAGNWVARAPREERPRRERVASALAMELIAVSLDGPIFDYGEGKPLIEWSCALLAKQPRSEFERMWHLASIAVAQGAVDSVLYGVISGADKKAGHFDHSLARFPDDDRLKLARLLTRHELRVISTVQLTPQDVLPIMAYRFDMGAGVERLAETFTLLGALEGPMVRDEARLRRGVLQLITGKIPAASRDLGEAAASSSPFVAYLGNLLLGSIYYNSGETDAAVARYARAAHLVPATSARIGLAAALLKQGNTREAADRATPLPTEGRVDDPWRLYGLGLFHDLPLFLAGMRAELR